MERAVFDRMNAVESQHWWFVARRQVISALIDRQLKRRKAAILEAGCGTGGNLQMLARFGQVDAFEFDTPAREAARAKSGLDVRFGALPDELPFSDRRYDLIGLFDVLEHVEADIASLAALRERLAPDGVILVTVPAFPFLWSRHDVRHRHFRRYTRKTLAAAAQAAGLKITYSSYFNALLFPAAVVSRTVKRLTGSEAPDDAMPPAWLNRILTQVFGMERRLVGRVNLPVGLSLAAVLEQA